MAVMTMRSRRNLRRRASRDALPEGELLVQPERGFGVSLERERSLQAEGHRRQRRRRWGGDGGAGVGGDEGVHRVLVHVEDEAGGALASPR